MPIIDIALRQAIDQQLPLGWPPDKLSHLPFPIGAAPGNLYSFPPGSLG